MATITIPSKNSRAASGLLNDKKSIFIENSLVVLCIVLNIIMSTLDLLLIGGISLYFRRKGWKDIGLGKPTNWAYVVIIAIILAIVWQSISYFALKPLVENITGVRTDLSLFKSLYGDYTRLPIFFHGFSDTIGFLAIFFGILS